MERVILAAKPKVHPEQMEMFQPEFGQVPSYPLEKIEGMKRIPFGFLNDKLYLGERHHMAIMQYINEREGIEWEDIMKAEQAWGWVRTRPQSAWMGTEPKTINPGTWNEWTWNEPVIPDLGTFEVIVEFATDAGKLDQPAQAKAKAALEKHFGVKIREVDYKKQPPKYAPNYQKNYGEKGYYKDKPVDVDVVSKWVVGQQYAEIKFVSLPDRILIGENTYHAHLLQIEYGDQTFPAGTIAIGRALVKDEVVMEISFDFATSAQGKDHAIHQLEEYAEAQGYLFAPEEGTWLQGLSYATRESLAWAMVGGRIYYGDYHAEIIDRVFPRFDIDEIQGVFGYMTSGPDGWLVSIYSDFLNANQDDDPMKVEKAIRLIKRDYDVTKVETNIAPDWMGMPGLDPFAGEDFDE